MATETDTAPETGGESGGETGAAEKPWLKMYPEGVDWQATLEIAPLWENLDRAVARYPNHNLLDFLDRKFTYSQIGDLVNRAARGFRTSASARASRSACSCRTARNSWCVTTAS